LGPSLPWGTGREAPIPGLASRFVAKGLSASKQIVETGARRTLVEQDRHSATLQGLSDYSRLNYPFDSSTEIGIQSLRGGSARKDRHRSMRISDGWSTVLRIAAVASKKPIASDQRRSL
jgi:hypothetical protein